MNKLIIFFIIGLLGMSCASDKDFAYETFQDLQSKNNMSLAEYLEDVTYIFVDNVIPTKYDYQDSFLNQILVKAFAQDLGYGIPLEIMTAQAILESGWGRSKLSRKHFNYFGIKEYRKGKNAAYMVTNEVVNGKRISKKAKFRKYDNPMDCFADRVIWFHQNHRYAGKDFSNMDYIQFADMLQEQGYATDPNYSKKLKRIVKMYRLDDYSKFIRRIAL